MLKDFSSWKEYPGNSEGSGRSEKIWLENDNEIGVFKFPKVKKDKYGNIIEVSTEYIAEKLSSIIAKTINIKNAEIDVRVL